MSNLRQNQSVGVTLPPMSTFTGQTQALSVIPHRVRPAMFGHNTKGDTLPAGVVSFQESLLFSIWSRDISEP
jgi:hypothetical protein